MGRSWYRKCLEHGYVPAPTDGTAYTLSQISRNNRVAAAELVLAIGLIAVGACLGGLGGAMWAVAFLAAISVLRLELSYPHSGINVVVPGRLKLLTSEQTRTLKYWSDECAWVRTYLEAVDQQGRPAVAGDYNACFFLLDRLEEDALRAKMENLERTLAAVRENGTSAPRHGKATVPAKKAVFGYVRIPADGTAFTEAQLSANERTTLAQVAGMGLMMAASFAASMAAQNRWLFAVGVLATWAVFGLWAATSEPDTGLAVMGLRRRRLSLFELEDLLEWRQQALGVRRYLADVSLQKRNLYERDYYACWFLKGEEERQSVRAAPTTAN